MNGCCHGELDVLYGIIDRIRNEQNIKLDLLICCGDFQVNTLFKKCERAGSRMSTQGGQTAHRVCLPIPLMFRCSLSIFSPIWCLLSAVNSQSLRTNEDLRFFCAPPKYRQLRDFHKYYSGEKRAPVLTIVIGGNHEAPNVLRELCVSLKGGARVLYCTALG